MRFHSFKKFCIYSGNCWVWGSWNVKIVSLGVYCTVKYTFSARTSKRAHFLADGIWLQQRFVHVGVVVIFIVKLGHIVPVVGGVWVWQETRVVRRQCWGGAHCAVGVVAATAAALPGLDCLVAADPRCRRNADKQRHERTKQNHQKAELVEVDAARIAVVEIFPTSAQLRLVEITRDLDRRRNHVEHRKYCDLKIIGFIVNTLLIMY